MTTPTDERTTRDRGVLTFAALALGGLAAHLARAQSGRQAALLLVGALAGLVLYHAAFGFTGAFRAWLSEGRGAGVRAQMLMLAVACLVFFPLLTWGGKLAGLTLKASQAPVGTSLVIGAFIFGVGMQLGGGCASGTLFTVGGGNVRMLVTLAFFIVGSVLGLFHAPFWEALPHLPPVSLLDRLGVVGGLALSLAVFGVIAWLTTRREPQAAPTAPRRRGLARVLAGPWPLAVGALGLVAVNVATLLLAGRPWGVTAAFGLWGSKTLAALGVDVAAWPAWSSPARLAQLRGSVLADVTSVMDIGIVLGALAASGLAGKFEPSFKIPPRSLVAAILGGILLGYGARLASGCNIGAYFSGIASGSLHGWVWFPAALAGNALGIKLRPRFGLGGVRSSTPAVSGARPG